jgi:hypothetical protein
MPYNPESQVDMRKSIINALVVAGMMAGCGGVEVEADEASNLSTREDATVVWCTDQFWRVEFYADAAHTILNGWISCDCYAPQQRSGTLEGYQVLVYNEKCDLN